MRAGSIISAATALIAACSSPARAPDASTRPEPGGASHEDGGAPIADARNADTPHADATVALDATPLPDACIPLPSGAAITLSTSTTYCAGTATIAALQNGAAITIRANGVTLACEGTMIASATGVGTNALPTIGILVDGADDVMIDGCGARGFRYGLVARNASRVIVMHAHFDDNFTDPGADWVQDTVQGGGVRLEHVDTGTVADSTFARNWNGIELRAAHDVVVKNNRADHASNAGATLVGASRNRLSSNDFSWAIRGANLAYPSNWFGVDTKDSAGILVDAGSAFNRIDHNIATYGGDGIFIRAVTGSCATDNVVEANDTSFSPHNAIECWCNRNQFLGNTASSSDYGLWLGGMDEGIVRGNEVAHDRTDGISIQIGEDRHTIIEANHIHDNGRTGILLTGREIQSWDPLTKVGPNLANSSHIVVAHNDFASNGPCAPWTACDVFIQSTRGVLMAANCSPGGATAIPSTGVEAEGIWSIGQCEPNAIHAAPIAALASIITATAGAVTALDASSSRDPAGLPLAFHWLVQRAGIRFVPATLPEVALLGPRSATATVSFPGPGLWDIDVTADNGHLGAIAHQTIAVLPNGRALGRRAIDFAYRCTTRSCTTSIAGDAAIHIATAASVRITTNEAFPFAFYTPPTRDLALDLSTSAHLAAFFRASNPNPNGWQGAFPTFVLGSAQGSITYTPSTNLLPTSPDEWIYVEVPLSGGGGWTRTDAGASLARIDWIEIDADTWDYGAYTIWVDGMTAF